MISPHVVIVIPTYNERANIIPLIGDILSTQSMLREFRLSILVVDDSSPDGTGDVVRQYARGETSVHVLTGERQGLGAAYYRGFHFALSRLCADIIVQMDADFSHDPAFLPTLIRHAESTRGFVIGSRYIKHGTVPREWPWHRRRMSSAANRAAQVIGGLRSIADCTGGYRAIHADVFARVDLQRMTVTGYAFQVALLAAAYRGGVHCHEVPIHFANRAYGYSKLRLYDVAEFATEVFRLRLDIIRRNFLYLFRAVRAYLSLHPLEAVAWGLSAFGIGIAGLVFFEIVPLRTVALALLIVISLFIACQSIFTLIGMMYAWEDPERVEKNQSPKRLLPPHHSFTAIVPALHEDHVIGDTLSALAKIEYPEHLKEVLIVCRRDDQKTIQAVEESLERLGKENMRLLVPLEHPRNKPDKLNFALAEAHHDIVCVFDAEDTPHKDIYNIVNTTIIRDAADVVQSGVQLVNFQSHWFSTLNVLEYFFWFKSVLHFFAYRNVIPLGGNTVFFKRAWLKKIGGWDSDCLTEDAEIGIKLSASGARLRIIYDEAHATQEETPHTLAGFIKQRTRWNQGFLQVYKKRDWVALPTWTQRFLVGYILVWPEIQAFLFFYIAASIVMMVSAKLPVVITLISLLPLYLLLFHIIVLNVGLFEFTRKYRLPFPWWMPFKVFFTFIPFQIALGFSAARAVYREIRHNRAWEKTEHVNAHRISKHIHRPAV